MTKIEIVVCFAIFGFKHYFLAFFCIEKKSNPKAKKRKNYTFT